MVSMYAAVVTYARQTGQLLGQVTELRPLTCPIAKCPVLSEQFVELCFVAFEMIVHLRNGDGNMLT
jgi:hypothetical protein